MHSKTRSWVLLILIIIAGESVFILPFVLARVFRPTVLEAFQLDNVQLGLCFSIYGLVAFASYLFGGPLADRFSPRKLMSTALWMTALGGIVYASFPSLLVLKLLYGYWGFTTIFLFWAPMIKATRRWGGDQAQGKAFGFLDGGRGMVGALFGLMGVYVFSFFVPDVTVELSFAESQEALRYIILISSGIVALVGLLVWFFLRFSNAAEDTVGVEKIQISQIKEILKLPSVWLLMVIILCAYVGYKVTDVLSLYAKEVMHYSSYNAAKVGTFLLFIRPAMGILIGILADKTKGILLLLLSFGISLLGAILFASGMLTEYRVVLFMMSVFIVAVGVYAARSLYFAVMKSGKIPLMLTGTAVGLISLVGYTPDIFAGPIIGVLLDGSPGAQGHQYVFMMLAVFSTIGLVASWIFLRKYGRS